MPPFSDVVDDDVDDEDSGVVVSLVFAECSSTLLNTLSTLIALLKAFRRALGKVGGLLARPPLTTAFLRDRIGLVYSAGGVTGSLSSSLASGIRTISRELSYMSSD